MRGFIGQTERVVYSSLEINFGSLPIQNRRAYAGEAFSCSSCFQQNRQPVLSDAHVIIQEGDIFAFRTFGSDIGCFREAKVGFIVNQNNTWKAGLDEPQRTVCRAIIDDDDL